MTIRTQLTLSNTLTSSISMTTFTNMLLMSLVAFLLLNTSIVNSQQPRFDPKKCVANETYTTCSTLCERTCGKENQTCVKKCGPPKCQCSTNYYRNTTGKCVLKKDCNIKTTPPVKCPLNETFTQCSTGCERTCGEENKSCPTVCGKPKCQCNANYYRNTTGKCVLQKDCRTSGTNNTKASCDNVQCSGVHKCVMKQIQCNETTKCDSVPACTTIKGNVTAKSCSDIRCLRGSKCTIKRLQCSRAPYDTIATCIMNSTINATSCNNVHCRSGQKCILTTSNCTKSPCAKLPKCVNNGNTTVSSCRNVTCPAGTKCQMIRSPILNYKRTVSCLPRENNEEIRQWLTCRNVMCPRGTNCYTVQRCRSCKPKVGCFPMRRFEDQKWMGNGWDTQGTRGDTRETRQIDINDNLGNDWNNYHWDNNYWGGNDWNNDNQWNDWEDQESEESESREDDCGPKERFTQCKDCEGTCNNAAKQGTLKFVQTCRRTCRPGCACMKGLFRHPTTGMCIPREQCPGKVPFRG